MEKEVVVIGVRNWVKKGTNDKYFVVDYYRTDKFVPKTDFLSPIEYKQIEKKLDGKHGVTCNGLFNFNDYDKMYLSDIEL